MCRNPASSQMGYLSPMNLSSNNECSKALLCTIGAANTMGRLIAQERLALYCGCYAYPHKNEPSPVLKLDAPHTDRHRG